MIPRSASHAASQRAESELRIAEMEPTGTSGPRLEPAFGIIGRAVDEHEHVNRSSAQRLDPRPYGVGVSWLIGACGDGPVERNRFERHVGERRAGIGGGRSRAYDTRGRSAGSFTR